MNNRHITNPMRPASSDPLGTRPTWPHVLRPGTTFPGWGPKLG